MLFDTSESMRKDLKLSQESAIRFLDAIPRARDLLLIFFDRDIRISRYNSENQQGIFGRILEAKGEGFTALYDAIAVYVSRIAETPGRKVLVIFTDGDDTTSQVPPHEVQRLVRSTEVTIYPVAFPGAHRPSSADALRARSFLVSLAEASGGRVFQPAASRELAGIYQSILDELGTQYVLGYVSDNPKHDGKFHRITVELKRPGLKVRHRPGYEAPKDEPPKPAEEEVARLQAEGGRPSSDSTFRSSSRRRFCSSGSRAKTAVDLSHARFSMAGEPETTEPFSTKPGMPVWAVAITPSLDREVPGDAHLPGQGDPVADASAARDADLSGDHRVLADRDRVAHLHQVVELRAPADAGLAERGPVHGGQRADLDVVLDDDDADLRELVVPALAVPGEAEAVAADHGPVLHDDPAPEPAALAHLHARVDHAVLAHFDALVEHDVRVEGRARAHPHARPHDRERSHVHVRPEDRRGVHLRGRVHPGRGVRRRPDERHRPSEGQVGVVGDEAGQGAARGPGRGGSRPPAWSRGARHSAGWRGR